MAAPGTPLITRAEANMASDIAGILIEDDYHFDWAVVNQEDFNKTNEDGSNGPRFPRATIYQEPEENNLDDFAGAHANAYTNEAFFRIRVTGKLSTETANPSFAINAELNKALDDLKKVFGIDYHLGGVVDTIMYQRSVRLRQPSGDIQVPTELDTFWRVQYTQDRTFPDVIDP